MNNAEIEVFRNNTLQKNAMLDVDTITIAELDEMAARMFEYLVKAVVDVESERMVVDAELQRLANFRSFANAVRPYMESDR